MEEYLCLHCGNVWTSTVVSYRDWKRRKCPNCGKRRTVTRALFERAVDEITKSLQSSPPPYPPTPSAVSATFALLNEMFPDSSTVTVLLDVYKAACRKMAERPPATGYEIGPS
jgi:DNA-directed RNA polymerase subunit RPC12/RpoP